MKNVEQRRGTAAYRRQGIRMKLYLAGPMRGYPRFNFDHFCAVADKLRELGHTVFNPAEADIVLDRFNPDTDQPRPIAHYYKRDLPEVCGADGIVLLEGWENSVGAKREAAIARDCGIPAFDEDMRPIETENVLEEADRITSGARNNTYGPPEQDFARTAAMWTGLLQYKLRDGESIRPQDVAWMMIMLKASRAQWSDSRDHYTDTGGYVKCGWRCVEANNNNG